MAPSSRRNSLLARKIAQLQLRLAPLVPIPEGPAHPAFPKTLMAFHLLTEDELDSIAHYYHQSTPGIWSNHYPVNMNWDKEFLAKPQPLPSPSSPASKVRRHSRRLSQQEQAWLADLMKTMEDLQNPIVASQPEGSGGNSYAGLTDKERIRIKRRKVGKFIGLVGMETPGEEIAGRILLALDRSTERGREESRRIEAIVLGRRKVG